MTRTFLFLMTNLAAMFTMGVVLKIIGVQSVNIVFSVIIAGISGFLGSFISLVLAKWIALFTVNGKIIEFPLNERQYWLFDAMKYQSQLKGIKTPQLVIYNNDEINAFATGRSRNSAIVALSSGLLERLNNDEIKAILAHEISHISSGDMVTMTLIQGIINTFVIYISHTVTHIISTFFSEKKGIQNNFHIPYAVIYTVLTFCLGCLSSMIVMWFSRKREFYADAGAAKIVGVNQTIAALQKLKISIEPQEQDIIRTFCIHGRFSLSRLLASHPPIDERINALIQGTYL
ncbi:protease HtpX [Candidatus Tachikawaea gelatinosa]|uniref:Heat shock protein HtpX n=1 Tax=Candidatus Tachikawaea gelatinosa TaxID=1410383 RepID=A0A090ARQ5_9ENTR|nr:protease HtpX [Candidatus Tachikawaea gelatinosa]BAP58490.1 heat shock protein HtpX [Candidatus Tachikawaea gelatinosa]